ncbi:hypothetical protein KZZ07_08200 [Mameliella sp. CS4]|uniref:hypothetical protein n=1 Tax=Mameliella sp. CS4 TaxID=2862329 RepID=UPI001C5F9D29|nr:hypothetical protein [Mameliella sp. CS4]MBW4982519.1 hypothetical protein [Mameliella sp. CS4]
MKTILSIVAGVLLIATAVMTLLCMREWPVMRRGERQAAVCLVALFAAVTAGLTLYARGLQ